MFGEKVCWVLRPQYLPYLQPFRLHGCLQPQLSRSQMPEFTQSGPVDDTSRNTAVGVEDDRSLDPQAPLHGLEAERSRCTLQGGIVLGLPLLRAITA